MCKRSLNHIKSKIPTYNISLHPKHFNLWPCWRFTAVVNSADSMLRLCLFDPGDSAGPFYNLCNPLDNPVDSHILIFFSSPVLYFHGRLLCLPLKTRCPAEVVTLCRTESDYEWEIDYDAITRHFMWSADCKSSSQDPPIFCLLGLSGSHQGARLQDNHCLNGGAADL